MDKQHLRIEQCSFMKRNYLIRFPRVIDETRRNIELETQKTITEFFIHVCSTKGVRRLIEPHFGHFLLITQSMYTDAFEFCYVYHLTVYKSASQLV